MIPSVTLAFNQIRVVCFFTFVVLVMSMGVSFARETTVRVPTVRIVRPSPLSILTACPVLIQAETSLISDTAHVSVMVIAEYCVHGDGYSTVRETLAVDSMPPYETLWDCTDVPEQSWADLTFVARLLDGNRVVGEPCVVSMVLDRNRALPEMSMACSRTTSVISVDGVAGPDEGWNACPPTSMSAENNQYEVRTCWDRNNLYCMVFVLDRTIVTRTDVDVPGGPGLVGSMSADRWRRDGIGFLFDPTMNRRELPDTTCRMLYVWADGTVEGFRPEPSSHRLLPWGVAGMVAEESVNDDSLSGYVVEVAIPWSELDKTPGQGVMLGFDLIGLDLDNVDGSVEFVSWAGQPLPLGNPSEWGTLVLRDGPIRSAAMWTVLLVGVMAVAGVATILFRPRPVRRYSKTGLMLAIQHAREKESSQDMLVRQAEDFIRIHFMAQEISTALVARKLHVSGNYLARHYKRSTGRSLGAFVDELRVDKSVEFLVCSTRSIAEVGLSVGFTSPNSFIKAFSTFKGLTPREYRKKRSGSSS